MAQGISNILSTNSAGTGLLTSLKPKNPVTPFNYTVPKTTATTQNSSMLPVASKTTTAPKTALVQTPTKASTSGAGGTLGSYMGVPIYAGQDVAAQMAQIDAQNKATKTTTSTPTTTTSKTTSGTKTNTSTTAPPVRGLFGDVLASLSNPKASKETEAAMKAYQRAVENLGTFEQGASKTRQGIYEAPTSARVMSARDMALQSIQEQERARLQGVIQEQQAGIGFGQAQQGLDQAAMISAAGLATPSPAGYGQTVFDPTTGTFGGGSGGLDPSTAASQLAQDVISGTKTYEQAVASLGYAGGAGQQFLNNAIRSMNPSFNIPQATAQVTGQTDVLGQLPALESADTAAEGIKNKIVMYLNSNPHLNPSSLAVGNTLQQWIQGKQLTDPKYQTLFNYLNEYTSTLAPILGVGGDPTNLKTQIAQSFINAAASGQSIKTVLENMQGLSKGKIQDIRSGATGGGVVSSPTTGTGTGSGGLFDW